MYFRQLEYILKVAEMGNLTKAADELHMTQPALSHFLSKVEEEEGLKLFDRSTNPISLTYAGERYVETFRKILALNRQLQNEMVEITSWTKGRIIIGVPPVRSAYRLPNIIHEYNKKFPGIQFQIVEHNSHRLRDDVQSGRIDIAITPIFDDINGCECIPLYDEELFLVTQRGALPDWTYSNTFDGTQILHFEKLTNEKFIFVKNGQEIRKAINQILKSNNFTPKSVLEVTNIETCFSFASAGIGLSIVPKMNIDMIKPSSPIDIYRITDRGAFWPIGILFKNKIENLSKPILQFIELCRQN